MTVLATDESRKAGNALALTPLANTLASVEFMDAKPWA
jgi:hypothetical protein